MIALDQIAADIARGGLMAWNMETYFYDGTEILSWNQEKSPRLLRLHLLKVDEPDPKWRTDFNRFIDVTTDQILLGSKAEEIEAVHARAGTLLQNMCGNGHRTVIERIEEIEPREVAALYLDPHHFYVTRGGIILRDQSAR